MGLFSFIGGLLGGNSAGKSAEKAAQIQAESAREQIAETRRQFDLTRGDFAPYQGLGVDAVPHLSALLGLDGAEAMGREVDLIKASPLFTSLMDNGRDAILSSASASGGLRGGNTQDALSRMGADTLSSVIQNQLAGYGGAVGIGSGASGAVGNFGANAVREMNAARQSSANAQGQAQLIKGGIAAQNWSNAGSFLDDTISTIAGGAGGGGFNWKSLF